MENQYAWVVPLAFGTLLTVGISVLVILAKHGFGRITEDLQDHGRELRAIRRAVDTCVTWDDLGKEVGPIKEDVKKQDRRITVMETRCAEHHRIGK